MAGVPMKIATWNVNGIRARAAQLMDWLAQEAPDVLCLQEIKAAPEQVPDLLRMIPDYWSTWHGAGGYSGVALLVRRSLSPAEPAWWHPPFDMEQRSVAADIGAATVASVYVPNGGKDFDAKMRFLESLREFAGARRQAATGLLVCGDLNVTRADIDVHPKERKPRAIGQLPVERDALARILEEGLVDLARHLEPDNDALYTWWAPWRNLRQRNIGWRIDYVLASADLAARARQCRVCREVGTSDHAPVVAELTPP
jgi:exodeoxyribonuclease-3